MRHAMTLVVGLAVLMVASGVRADWDEGDPYKMHSPQLPDLDNGMNVLATHPKVLADDFLCTETGPITDIHIWGSWLNDKFPMGPVKPPNPGHVDFRLSIHSDIPAKQSPTGYSMPGELLWERDIHPSRWQWWADSDEEFYDPIFNEIIGTDTQVIQYNFFIDDDPFVQRQDTIYWLNVTAFPWVMPGWEHWKGVFGWKTSDMHWNDDAVFWVDEINGTSMTPQELIHPDTGESLDLAFVITPEPATLALLGLGAVGLMARRRRRQA